MKLKIYQVDAFSATLFGGNPAAVCPLNEWLDDEIMKKIANENNLSETAFFVPNSDGFDIRWFTPAHKEVDLCGHATLASSHVIFEHLQYTQPSITFASASGSLNVVRKNDQYILNFPADTLMDVTDDKAILKALGIQNCIKLIKGKDDYLVIVDSQKVIEGLNPNISLLSEVEARGVIVSAEGDEVDVVSRCFYPRYGVNEDPVTGSAHTTIIPYWAKLLAKNDIVARQLSQRGGELKCTYLGDRVELGGRAITYMIGEISI